MPVAIKLQEKLVTRHSYGLLDFASGGYTGAIHAAILPLRMMLGSTYRARY
jgi:hypothetical protein